jgi:hypothetical protein
MNIDQKMIEDLTNDFTILKMAAYAGKIQQSVLYDKIITAYDNFKNMSFDVTDAKQALAEYISIHCKTQRFPEPSSEHQKYRMSQPATDTIVMKAINNQRILYVCNVKTGQMFVIEKKTAEICHHMANMDFNTYLLMCTVSDNTAVARLI